MAFLTMVPKFTVDQIQKNLIADRFWRERRHPQWTPNYLLARDTVPVNRLIQRQSVNVPYMKKTLKTHLTQTNWPLDPAIDNATRSMLERFLLPFRLGAAIAENTGFLRSPSMRGGCPSPQRPSLRVKRIGS